MEVLFKLEEIRENFKDIFAYRNECLKNGSYDNEFMEMLAGLFGSFSVIIDEKQIRQSIHKSYTARYGNDYTEEDVEEEIYFQVLKKYAAYDYATYIVYLLQHDVPAKKLAGLIKYLKHNRRIRFHGTKGFKVSASKRNKYLSLAKERLDSTPAAKKSKTDMAG